MRITRSLFNSVKSNEFNPCNLYFCKCIEYLYPNKKEDIEFYKQCHQQNIQENNVNNIKITWEKYLIQNRFITVEQLPHPRILTRHNYL